MTSRTVNAFVCGFPVKHSRSPLIHGYWLRQLGIDGTYTKIEVAPGALAEFFERIRDGEFIGGNLTIPHKIEAKSLVDRHDEAVSLIGAVNTVWMEDRTLWGTNTDWSGFVESLDAQTPDWDDEITRSSPAVVLGAGGASAGILYGLQRRGFETVILANRTRDKAEAMVRRFPKLLIEPVSMDQVCERLSEIRLLINTTSLGMQGMPPLPVELLAALSAMPDHSTVTDIVYVPLETELLKKAEACGHRTANGLGMLLHQAVPGFEKWFGRRPDVTPDLWKLVIDDLGGNDG